jgi:hypothetical protein
LSRQDIVTANAFTINPSMAQSLLQSYDPGLSVPQLGSLVDKTAETQLPSKHLKQIIIAGHHFPCQGRDFSYNCFRAFPEVSQPP